MKFLIPFALLFIFCVKISPAQLPIDEAYTAIQLDSIAQIAIVKNDSLYLGDIYTKQAKLAKSQGLAQTCLDWYLQSIACYEVVGDSTKLLLNKRAVAGFYMQSDLKAEALAIYQEAFEYYKRTENLKLKTHLAAQLNDYYRQVNDKEKEAEYLAICRSYNKILKDTFLEIGFLIEETYQQQRLKQLDSAIAIAHQSLALSKAIDNNLLHALSLYNIGFLSQFNGDYTTAIKYLLDAEANTKPRAYSTQRRQCFRHLAQSYARLKQYPEAYKYAVKYAVLNDSILQKERQNELNALTLAYETKEKQILINELEQDKQLTFIKNRQQRHILYSVIIVLALLLGLLFLGIWTYRQKIENEQLIAKQKDKIQQQEIAQLKQAIQLTAMQSMLEGQEQEQARIARDLHDSLGGLLSSTKHQFELLSPLFLKNKKEDNFTQIHGSLKESLQEVRTIAHSMQPPALAAFGLIPALKDLINRYNTPDDLIVFQYFNIPDNLDKDSNLHLYRIIQELLTNAIKYAEANQILVQVNANENDISVLVEDDGKGFDLIATSKGMGLKNIEARAKIIQAELDIDSQIAMGTTVHILVPRL